MTKKSQDGKGAAPPLDPPFDKVWPADTPDPDPIPDQVSTRIIGVPLHASHKSLGYEFELPGQPDLRYWVVHAGWLYALRSEGQSPARVFQVAEVADPEAVAADWSRIRRKHEEVYLRWDSERREMVVSPLSPL
jgi:hypothetical protein